MAAPIERREVIAPGKKPRVRITVRATAKGVSVDCDCGRHYFRDRDEVFDVWEDAFVPGWMVRSENGQPPPELPPPPPETTLPNRNQPIPIAG